MVTRRVLALYTLLCLLVGMGTVPTSPQLVCRITGVPMAPVAAPSESAKRSCCDVAVSVMPDGMVRYALTSPGCCDLRPGFQRQSVPASAPTAPEFPVAVLTSAPSAPLLPPVTGTVLPSLMTLESAPRAPPIRAASPRAPPFVS